MKPSRFNVFIPLQNNETLVFNTFSDSRIVAEQNIADLIRNCDSLSSLDNNQEEASGPLKELGMIIDDDVDEGKEIEYWFQRLKYDTSSMKVTLLTTMACNMACSYCFEQGAESSVVMDDTTASAVCDWLCDKVRDVRPNDLTVTFFGGEPLMNVPVVRSISEQLHQHMQEAQVTLNLEIVTNGFFLERELVDHLLPLGLRRCNEITCALRAFIEGG